MSDEERIVRSAYAAFAAGDIGGLAALFAADAVCEEPPEFPFGGAHAGVQAVRSYFRQSRAMWQRLQCELMQVSQREDRVLVVVRHHGTLARTGAPAEAVVADVVTVTEGQITSVVGYRNVDDALAEFA